MGAVGTLYMMIGIGTGAENFATGGSFFVAISSASSGVQKKENSDSDFRCRNVGEEETFIDDVISFVSPASGFQKNERSETGFMYGVTGNEMNFVGGVIQRDLTC